MKNKWFYGALLAIYLIFIFKDNIIGLTNTDELDTVVSDTYYLYYKSEYESLADIYNIETYSETIIYSKVINRNIYEFFKEITLNKGLNDGIDVNMAAVNADGLIGIVKSVDDNSSTVYLLTNDSLMLSVKINDTYGVLYSKDNVLYVKNIAKNANINIGDVVYTSGLTSVMPNIYVGIVTSIKEDSLGLEYILTIDGVSTDKLSYIAVVGVS